MRYAEILKEASDQYWDMINERYVQLEHELLTDPDGVLAESEYREKELLTQRGADPDEERFRLAAIRSFQELIERAQAIISRRDG
jgi:hypothetical protein